MENEENRTCHFRECLSYYDGKEIHQFMGHHDGILTKEMLGKDTNKKWSDLWYVFVPKNYTKTLAQMTDEEREQRQLERKDESVNSMNEFAKWYLGNKD